MFSVIDRRGKPGVSVVTACNWNLGSACRMTLARMPSRSGSITRHDAAGCTRLAAIGKALLTLSFVVGTAVAAVGETVRLTGDLGYVPQVVKLLPAGSQVDARSALFHVANSGSLHPTVATPCDSGALPVNPYPLQIRESPAVTLQGGLFAGEVPLMSDWRSTYCNSAGVLLRDSVGAVVEGLRMRRLWDAVRLTESASGFILRGSWISEVRDDCIENDYLNGGLIEDMLLDGCFVGLSMRPPKGQERSPSGGPVVLRKVLMRMQSYLYKERTEQGPPFKVDEAVPEIEVYDSIIAMDDQNTVSQLRLGIGWSRIGNCSGNLLLWTADTPWPEKFARPPACFRFVEGEAARALWQEARRNWIDCHPMIERFAEDPASTALACEPDAYGGHAEPRRQW